MSAICRSIYSSSRLGLPLLAKPFYSKQCMSRFPKERLLFDLSLYLVANRPSFSDERLFFSKIMEAVKGGVSCVQLRDHESDFATTLKIALRLKKMLQREGVSFFINTLNLIEIARAVDADGVFLEEKFSLTETRKLLGQKAIIGIPVRTIEEVISAGQTISIDYLSVKISPSKQTCPKNDHLWGMDGLRNIQAISPHRIVAIGGLDIDDAESVSRELRPGDGLGMAGGILRKDDPRGTAQKIQAILERTRGKL